MTTITTAPGLYLKTEPPPTEPSPLRSDVAGFIGRTRRGPVGVPVRVEGWRDYIRRFGGLESSAPLTYGARGYFENGGEIGHFVRIADPEEPVAAAGWHLVRFAAFELKFEDGGAPSTGTFQIVLGSETSGAIDFDASASNIQDVLAALPNVNGNVFCSGGPLNELPVRIHFDQMIDSDVLNVDPDGVLDQPVETRLVLDAYTEAFEIRGESPGAWAHDVQVFIRHFKDRSGSDAEDEFVEFEVRATGEPRERFRVRMDPSDRAASLVSGVEDASNLIRLTAKESPPDYNTIIGPRRSASETRVFLKHPSPTSPLKTVSVQSLYRSALVKLNDIPEVAILAAPGLTAETDVSREQVFDFFSEAAGQAAREQDRLVVVDVVSDGNGTDETPERTARRFVEDLRTAIPSKGSRRAAAVYFPMIRVPDPLGGLMHPLRTLPNSAHVCGVISRGDRERGAHHTPANMPLLDAVDLEDALCRNAIGRLNELGVNALRCVPSRHLTVWGGRTLDLSRDGRFLAHRRYIHRLVRVIRRVAEPVVFDTNGPQLWLTLVRTIGGVLLEAFRSGSLQGERPEEAFRVRCDDTLNPITERENGRVTCEIDLALAAPMEFITIRIAMSRNGELEVFDQ
jgi:hypothetical protein